MKPRSTHRLASLAIAALAALVLSGCGAALDTDTDAADAEVASRTPRPHKTAASAATSDAPDAAASSPAEDALEEQPSVSAAAAAGGAALPDLLLTAEQVPGLGDGSSWAEGRTTKREPRALAGTCHRFSMLSIGAMRVAHRDYTAADGSTGARANELVATFADTKTAWRAFQVLKSWRDNCGETLDKWEKHDVGALQKVDVGAAQAHTYLLVYGPADGAADSSYFDAEGLTLVGNRIAVLRIAYVGQDYDYPAGKEPITAAVRAAAEKLS